MEVTADLWTFDVGAGAVSVEAYAELMTSRVRESWDSGADIVVFPEFAWLGLAKFVDRQAELKNVSVLFWETLWPELQRKLARPGKMAVLGSVPFARDDGRILNRVPLLIDGKAGHQDKLNLTPWESALGAGDVLHVWEFAGLRVAVIICLDIEVPELSVALRGRGVDLILVPSATENILGLERVGRCASARSVELGCYVGVAHLVGVGDSELIDGNVGRVAWFAPSQSPFGHEPREKSSEVVTSGFHGLRHVIDAAALAHSRANVQETNPSLLTAGAPRVELGE